MSLKVIKKGLLDTIQDTGRYGYRHLGINPGGVMDPLAAATANILVGNTPQTAVIEMHFPAAVFVVQQDCLIAISGADFSATLHGKSVPLEQPLVVAAGAELRFRERRSGARAYIAIRENMEITEWLGSCSTNAKLLLGGWQGRALKPGDTIPFRYSFQYGHILGGAFCKVLPWRVVQPVADHEIYVLKGPEWNWMRGESDGILEGQAFTISTVADRMGYQLEEPISCFIEEQLLSSGTSFGTIQLLPGGKLIILMADHQVSGGYPRIAQVITGSLPALAQMQPGEKIKFRFCSQAYAESVLMKQQLLLTNLQTACAYKLEAALADT